jgi:hypothetical protein
LAKLKSGDGSNSAKLYRDAPKEVAALLALISNQGASGCAYLGDFTEQTIGLRQGVKIELTQTGGDSFTKHQVLIKAVWRGDFVALQPRHLCYISGIN